MRSVLWCMVLRTSLVLSHGALRSKAPRRPARRTVSCVPARATKPGATTSLHACADHAVAVRLPVSLLLLAVRLLLVA